MDSRKPVLITGAAGFIGFHIALALLNNGQAVVGLDNVNQYYDPQLKWDRLGILAGNPLFRFVRLDLRDRDPMEDFFRKNSFVTVVHLAAQAGVRYSITHPHDYIESNVCGFLNLLEGCRYGNVGHLVFASSSSVYGANEKTPFSVHDNVDHPISFYAVTKKTNELMAHCYANLYSLPCTGLRFFTVYGPWGRPDMALFLFTRAILAGEPIKIFNNGNMRRDFTYIDDVIGALLKIIEKPPGQNPDWNRVVPDPGSSFAPYRVYNIGSNRPVELLHFINTIEDCLGMEAKKDFLPMQPGDVRETSADIQDLVRDFGFHPKTSIREGIASFVEWYLQYYRIGAGSKKVLSDRE